MSLYTVTEQGKERPWAPIVFPLSADTENEIMFDVADQINEELWDDIEATFPDFHMPLAIQPSREALLASYTSVTDPIDYPFLRDRQYLKKVKDGVYPELVSPFWRDLVDMPPVFEFVQREFMRLTNFIEAAEE